MSKLSTFFKLYRLPILSGILIGTSYAPFPCWALLFCFVPLWLFILDKNRNLKEIFWGAWITQFILSLIGFHWVSYVTHEFGLIPWPAAILVLMVFCSLVHLYFPITHLVAVWMQRKWKFSPGYLLATLVLLFNLFERYWPSLFPWNFGYPYYSTGLPIYQWADIVGFLGLSLFTLAMNAWATHWWRNKKSFSQAAMWVAVFLLLNAGGYLHAQKWAETDLSVKVMIVQANIGNAEKVQAEKGFEFQSAIINKFLELMKEGLQKNPADVVVWPETAFPSFLDQNLLNMPYPQMLIQFIKENKVALITGAYSRAVSGTPPRIKTYNSVAFLTENGELTSMYRKTHLLAYGEYLPFSETFPILLTWIPMVGNFGRGNGPESLSLPVKSQNIQWGTQICYEGLYPEFSAGLARAGAQIFVNTTNDSWYGGPSEPQQHMYMTFARAIENRRPLVRSTNTGVSSVVLASGKILEQSPLHQEWAGTYEVSYLQNPPLTFFSKWGHLDSLTVILLFGITVILGRQNGKKQRSDRP